VVCDVAHRNSGGSLPQNIGQLWCDGCKHTKNIHSERVFLEHATHHYTANLLQLFIYVHIYIYTHTYIKREREELVPDKYHVMYQLPFAPETG
jgi:hypothetical protein